MIDETSFGTPRPPESTPFLDTKAEEESGAEVRAQEIPEIYLESNNTANVLFKNLALSEAQPTSPQIAITVEKTPFATEVGKRSGDVYFDGIESDAVKYLETEAAALKALPEIERPRRVLELLRAHVQYAYPNVVDELTARDPELGEWVAANVSTNRNNAKPVTFTDVINSGYGVCTHLSPAYLWLAEKAGLEGAIFTSDVHVITNVIKEGTSEPLFKSTAVGQPAEAHAWVELKLSDGQWMPVDPSTQLVGDSPADKNTFTAAGYKSFASYQFEASTSIPELKAEWLAPIFNAGEAQASTTAQLRLRSTIPRRQLGKPPTPATNIPYTGPADMAISVESAENNNEGRYGLELVEVRVA